MDVKYNKFDVNIKKLDVNIKKLDVLLNGLDDNISGHSQIESLVNQLISKTFNNLFFMRDILQK